MKYRFDRYGNPISQLGYGCMRFSRKGSGIDYVTNSSGSLSRKVSPIEGTQFCSPEPGFSIISATPRTLELRMIDKTGKVLHTVTRNK